MGLARVDFVLAHSALKARHCTVLAQVHVLLSVGTMQLLWLGLLTPAAGEASYGAALLARAGWHQHQAQQAGNPAQLLPLQCAKSEQQTEEDRLR